MTPFTHEEYLSQLSSQLILHADNPMVWAPLCQHGEELAMVLELSLDPVRDALAAVYCPTGQGAPLCPGGCRMRRHGYDPNKAAFFFTCPALRPNGKGERLFHADECPFHQNCEGPEKKMGYTKYISSEADLRLFPPIPRDSARFTMLYNERTSTERGNAVEDRYHVDRSCRNAAFALIRLTFVNIAKHARVRWLERCRAQSAPAILTETLAALLTPPAMASLPN